MSRKLTTLLPLIVMLVLTPSAIAQTPDATMGDVQRLQSISVRMYAQTEESLRAAVTGGGGIPPITAFASAFAFDTEENAEQGFDQVITIFTDEMLESLGISISESPAEPIEDLGDRAELQSGTLEQSGLQLNVSFLTVRDADVVYLFVALSLEENEEVTRDLAEHALENGVSSNEVQFDAGGTSTGGAFDAFPSGTEVDILRGMRIELDLYQGNIGQSTPTG